MPMQDRAQWDAIQPLIDGFLEYVCIVDAAGAIRAINRAWRRLVAESGDGTSRTKAARCFPPCTVIDDAHAGALAAGVQAVLDRKRDEFVLEYACRSASEERWFEAKVRRFELGGASCALVCHQDVTAARHADEAHRLLAAMEIELRKVNAELEDRIQARTRALQLANDELNALSYSVSHDLRAPLRAIQGFSSMALAAQSESADPRMGHWLLRIQKNAERMGELVDALRRLSEVSRQEVRREHLDLTSLATEVLESLRRSDTSRATRCTIQHELTAYGDRALVRLVLENLLGNAWKFTTQRAVAEIRFGSRRMNGVTVYFVEDNGAGFDMRHAGKLFAPFQRLHRAVDFDGTGIGLSIVQRAVSKHGGRAWAEGNPGMGACFYFTLQ